MTERSIVLISYHFHPSIEIGGRRVTALARYLAGRGIRVFVVSEFGGKDYPEGSEIWPGVVTITVKKPRRLLLDNLVVLKKRLRCENDATGQQSSPLSAKATPVPKSSGGLGSRIRDTFFRVILFVDPYKKWSWRAARAAIRVGSRHGAHAVISSGPPHTMLLAGTYAGRRLGIPHIADLRDPWTDFIPVTESTPRGLELYVLRWLERWVMKNSAAVTSTGATVADLLTHRYDISQKVQVIRNGFDGEAKPAILETGGRLSILFAGELYAKRNPFPLLTALDNLLANPNVEATRIKMIFMGRCATYNGASLSDWMRGKRVGAIVTILPQMPAEIVAHAVDEATVLLNLCQQQPLSVPAKTFEQLASGREILLICENDSETAQVVAGISGVLQVDQEDEQALERTLIDLYQRHVVEGRLSAPDKQEVRNFSREAMHEKFLSLIDSLIAAG